MNNELYLVQQFEANRMHMRAVAYRILGDSQEIDDTLQEAWIRLSASDADQIENITGWLTTVVARICLNVLRARQRRPAQSVSDARTNMDQLADRTVPTPEERAELADAMGLALLVVLEMLAPAERISFVLHDMFSVPFDEISEMLGRSPEACRQLASRARRRVRTANDPVTDPSRQREVVDAFLTASKSGDFRTLLSLLSADVELVSDAGAIAIGAPERKDGPFEVATRFAGGARAARLALLDGIAGFVWAQGGAPKIAFDFTVVAGKVTRIDMIGDQEVLDDMTIEYVQRGR